MDEIKQVTQSPVVDESQLKVLRSVARALLLLAGIAILIGIMEFYSGFSLFSRGFISFGVFIFVSPLLLVGGFMLLFLRKGLLHQERWSYTVILGFFIFLVIIRIIQMAINLLQGNFAIFSLIYFLIPVLFIYYIKKLSPTLTREREGTSLRFVGAIITASLVVLANLVSTFLLVSNFE
ncbi:hypothetical protein IID24_01835 [Patescibacteria group bacterium]|nr:hypothetical protein [Patescibacteria group bacterium]